MIYTSNYARKGTDPTAIAISYSIVPGIREWFGGIHLPVLGPSGSLLGRYKAGAVTDEEFAFDYIETLTKRSMSPERIIKILPETCFLLCYERPFEFCHRRILADYIHQGTGVHVPEWFTDQETYKFKQASAQQTLVDSLLEF